MNTDKSLSSDDDDDGEEVIELSPRKKKDKEEVYPELEEASKQDFSAWEDSYKKLMGKTINEFHVLLKHKEWELIISNDEEESFRLFSQIGDEQCAKVTGILNARAERVFYVIKDQDPDTRLKWDGEHMKSMCELQTFKTSQGDIKVVHSEIKSPFPLYAERVSLGIQWCGYNAKTRTHKLVFKTTQHWLTKIPSDKVAINGLVGVIVRALDNPESTPKNPKEQCEVIIIVQMDVGSTKYLGVLKEFLRQRLHLYERVAINWKQYYEGRNPKLLENRK